MRIGWVITHFQLKTHTLNVKAGLHYRSIFYNRLIIAVGHE